MGRRCVRNTRGDLSVRLSAITVVRRWD